MMRGLKADGLINHVALELSDFRLLPKGSRLRLRYTAYYDHGVVAAVRYRRIEAVPGG